MGVFKAAFLILSAFLVISSAPSASGLRRYYGDHVMRNPHLHEYMAKYPYKRRSDVLIGEGDGNADPTETPETSTTPSSNDPDADDPSYDPEADPEEPEQDTESEEKADAEADAYDDQDQQDPAAKGKVAKGISPVSIKLTRRLFKQCNLKKYFKDKKCKTLRALCKKLKHKLT